MATGCLSWSFGLVNSDGKYLTAEKFQFKVVANGVSLKKKQVWSMQSVGVDTFALKCFLGRYLTSDKNGNLDCSGEEVGPDQTFAFETQADGRVAIRTHKRYIGGSGDNMTGFDQAVGPANLFTIHLAIHPQVNIFSVNRKSFMHLNVKSGELCCNERIAWGYDATIILEFHDGKYALRAANTMYLSKTGKLMDSISNDCLFMLVFKGNQVAFQDFDGKHLTAVGATATVQSRKPTIGKDELFELIDSRPQVQLIASNGKYLSVREGIEVRAKQAEVTDKEIFQMEPVDMTDFSGSVKYRFRSCDDKLWTAGSASLTANSIDPTDLSTHFSIEWMGPKIAIKASNDKYMSIKPNGQIFFNASVEDNNKFTFEFINRPILVLRGEFGFVGVKGGSGTLECNRSQYDVFGVVGKAGAYQFRGANGKYFQIESDGTVSINGETPTDFFLELRAPSRMIIVTPDGKYLHGQQSGVFAATGDKIDSNTLWEY